MANQPPHPQASWGDFNKKGRNGSWWGRLFFPALHARTECFPGGARGGREGNGAGTLRPGMRAAAARNVLGSSRVGGSQGGGQGTHSPLPSITWWSCYQLCWAGGGAPFSTIARLPDGFAGLGFDSSGRTTHPFPISHPSHAGVEVDGVWRARWGSGWNPGSVRGSLPGQELQPQPRLAVASRRLRRKPGCPIKQHPAPKPNEAERSVPVRPRGSFVSASIPLLARSPPSSPTWDAAEEPVVNRWRQVSPRWPCGACRASRHREMPAPCRALLRRRQ